MNKNPMKCETVYVYGGSHQKQLDKLIDSIRLNPELKKKDLKKAGFTNYCKDTFYYSRHIHQDDNYPVSFSLSINAKPLAFREVDVLDENFLQPHPCGRYEYQQIEQYIHELVNKGIFLWESSEG